VYSYAPLDTPKTKASDVEAQDDIQTVGGQKNLAGKVSTLHGSNRPFFHIDVPAAVESAVSGIEQRLAYVSTESSEKNLGHTELSTKQA
jgi:sodium-independent sulfate anion transporter 11